MTDKYSVLFPVVNTPVYHSDASAIPSVTMDTKLFQLGGVETSTYNNLNSGFKTFIVKVGYNGDKCITNVFSSEQIASSGEEGVAYEFAKDIATIENYPPVAVGMIANMLLKAFKLTMPAPALEEYYYDYNINANGEITSGNQNSVEQKSHELPGMSARVDAPCGCKSQNQRPLRNMVMHLNDVHQWSREKIADWLDELHDSGVVDLTFKVKE